MWLHEWPPNQSVIHQHIFMAMCIAGQPTKMSLCNYSIVWDNTQKLVQARDHSRQSGNRMLQWANAYAARSRVVVDQSLTHNRLWASQIPLSVYLPKVDDYSTVRQRMIVIVSRILEHHLAHFRGQPVVSHIKHRYSSQSAMKSELVNTSVHSLYFTDVIHDIDYWHKNTVVWNYRKLIICIYRTNVSASHYKVNSTIITESGYKYW